MFRPTRRMPQHCVCSMITLLIVCLTTAAIADDDKAMNDWPQWRGPHHTGVSAETNWNSLGTPEPLWRKALGFGHSSFSIAAGRLYTLGYDLENARDVIYCLDAETGAEIWTHTYPADFWDNAHDGGALTTPTIDGEWLYTSNREGNLMCLSASTGDVRWQTSLEDTVGVTPPTWGFSCSPLVVGDIIVMNVDKVAAFDKHTGENVWTTESFGNAYSTPMPFDYKGTPMLAVLNGRGLVVVAQESGSTVAVYDWQKTPQIYPMTPVVIDDRIFISAGYNRGCAMLQLTDDGLTPVWESRVMRNKMSGAVLFEGHLYGFDEAILKCIDLQGNEKWRKRGLGTGSMLVFGGRLLLVDGKGEIIVAEANPEAYVELSRHDVLDDGTYWSTPVLSNGRVYCRNSMGSMVCMDYSGADMARSEGGPSVDALPSAQELFATHVRNVGGERALRQLRSFHLTGESESLHNVVQKGKVDLVWQAGEGFSWSVDNGFVFAHDATMGWFVRTDDPPAIVEGDALDALRDTGDFRRLADPEKTYASMRTVAIRKFDERDCFVIEVTTHSGSQRTLYFDVQSGLYAGHESPGSPMWVLRDYREVDGVKLPMQWTFYEPEIGAMYAASFVDGEINARIADDAFTIPDTVRLLMRSDAEKEAENSRLREKFAHMLGTWARPGRNGGPDTPLTIGIDEGFITMQLPGRERDFIMEPDEQGRMVLFGVGYVWLEQTTDDAGLFTGFNIVVDGNVIAEVTERMDTPADQDNIARE